MPNTRLISWLEILWVHLQVCLHPGRELQAAKRWCLRWFLYSCQSSTAKKSCFHTSSTAVIFSPWPVKLNQLEQTHDHWDFGLRRSCLCTLPEANAWIATLKLAIEQKPLEKKRGKTVSVATVSRNPHVIYLLWFSRYFPWHVDRGWSMLSRILIDLLTIQLGRHAHKSPMLLHHTLVCLDQTPHRWKASKASCGKEFVGVPPDMLNYTIYTRGRWHRDWKMIPHPLGKTHGFWGTIADDIDIHSVHSWPPLQRGRGSQSDAPRVLFDWHSGHRMPLAWVEEGTWRLKESTLWVGAYVCWKDLKKRNDLDIWNAP